MQATEQGFTLPPNSIDAERAVLGAMLQDKASVSLAVETLKKDDFFLKENAMLFEAMYNLQSVASPIDFRTVSEELKRLGYFDLVGGQAYLFGLADAVPSTVNIKSYIEIVANKATLRKLIDACNNINALCYKQDDSVENICNSAEKMIFDVIMQKSSENNMRSIEDVVRSTVQEIERLSNLKGMLSGVPTGFHDLDRTLTGMHGGEFILVGARPSMGKTAVAINMAMHASIEANKSTAIFSMEMPAEQIGMRLLCASASINMQRVRDGNLSDAEWIALGDVLNKVSVSPMYIDDSSGLSPSQLRSRCRRLKLEKGLDLIVIDYLQLLHSDRRNENRQNEVSEISRQLKILAMELNVPVIACSQLSRRAAKSTESHRPVLSDLRESGAIEQDADVVILVHRENYYKNKEDDAEDSQIMDNEGELIIAKQRNGPIGTIKVEWQPEFVRYTNLPDAKPVKFVKG
ncbi:MAG: replicative DNA helicase [Eubacteriales bacterium]|nr:replicative DNA helicase [Eubacteriales bacterium]